MLNSGLIGIGLLFGDIDIKGIKVKGLFPYLQQRKTARLEERKLTVEVETMEKDAKLKDIQRDVEIEKARKELESLRNVRAFESLLTHLVFLTKTHPKRKWIPMRIRMRDNFYY